jgi:hypothetical protein
MDMHLDQRILIHLSNAKVYIFKIITDPVLDVIICQFINLPINGIIGLLHISMTSSIRIKPALFTACVVATTITGTWFGAQLKSDPKVEKVSESL